MTASAIEGDREKCLDSGMNNYLAKPVRAQTLKALLETYLSKEKEEHDVPNLAAEAKSIVKQALAEDGVPNQPNNGHLDVKNALKSGAEEGVIRSRPPSIRKVTAQRIRPNGEKESADS